MAALFATPVPPCAGVTVAASFSSLPVVPSNAARLLLVEDAGPTTSPPPAGAAQAPSPRQNVLADADVPLFKLVTGKLPVTPVVKGNPVAFVKVALAGVPRTGATRVNAVPLVVAPVMPPNEPALLYWT
jgi:hypothetical protein